MNLDFYRLLETAFLSGIAALGFGALFNVSWKHLSVCFFVAGLAGIAKVIALEAGMVLAPASFVGALVAGILATIISRKKGCPHVIFSIPAVIPMVPGVLGFKTILGVLEILQQGAASSPEIVARTVSLGLNTGFIAIALAVGISFPSLTRLIRSDDYSH